MERQALEMAVNKCQTPCYVFDLDMLKERVTCIKDILGSNVTTCFAMKANPFLIKPMNEYTDRFEVCSPGEYEICIRQGIEPEKIVISGVNKTEQSMDRIVGISGGKGIYTMESPRHYDILSECAKKHKKKLDIYIRLSSGNQFGMDKFNWEEIAAKCCADEYLNLIGIHYYSGTQKKIKKVEKEISELCEYSKYLKDKFALDRFELEYGPGLSVAYFDTDKVDDAKVQLEALATILNSADVFSHISIEMGRFIASECGYYFTKVVDSKTTEDSNFVIVDGGIHQINYYGQLMGMKKPEITHIPDRQDDIRKWTVCGSLCTINDVIVRDLEMGAPKIGDAMVFHRCGAYSVTEGMALFLSRELPQINFYSVNSGFQCVREAMGTDIINSQREN